ncbi:MAG: alpha-amylase, partial [Anaerolineae bacterium]|nr:alpha-amylase [Anaerolineae bacterium]
LAKKHYARLWYPEPGTGGSIPSRAEFAMPRAEFDAAMPVEFWREVVDRVAQEVPDTLLLAEAFWLMEGYFVRTLGMHRVYNSAFMNMLRDEDNAKYRQIMKNTLEFDPEILKRYVNFMNNPDERTAVDQFGKGDKYFGVAALMATMPGLPMFGHGQVEGFTEKYGMEFRRPMWQEQPDPYLVERHMRELAPLLHQRPLFAEVENFRMYDFMTGDGHVVEDVFAYSNRLGDQRALVVYHNKLAEVKGWLKTSAPYLDKSQTDRPLARQDLAQGLALGADTSLFTVFRDTMTGLEYIRSNQDLHQRGLYVELGAYRYHVFQEFREVQETAWQPYAQLAHQLGGRGVPSIEEALRELVLTPVLYPFSAVVNADTFRRLMDELAPVADGGRQAAEGREQKAEGGWQAAVDEATPSLVLRPPSAVEDEGDLPTLPILLDEVEEKVTVLLTEIKGFEGGTGDPAAIAAEIRRELEALAAIPRLAEQVPAPDVADYPAAVAYLRAGLDHDPEAWGAVLAWIFTHSLGKIVTDAGFEQQSRTWLDEWRLGRVIAQTLIALGVEEAVALRAVAAVRVFVAHQATFDTDLHPSHQAYQLLQAWLKDQDIRQLLQVNRFQNALWFNQEAFERLVWGMLLRTTIRLTAQPDQPAETVAEALATRYRIVEQMRRAQAQSSYQVEKLLAAVRPVVDEGWKTEDGAQKAEDSRQPANGGRQAAAVEVPQVGTQVDAQSKAERGAGDGE